MRQLMWLLALVNFLDSCDSCPLAATRRCLSSGVTWPFPKEYREILHSGGTSREVTLPTKSEQRLVPALPGTAMSVTCQGLIYSPRIKTHLSWPINSLCLSSPAVPLGFEGQLCLHLLCGGPGWFTAGLCPVASSWHILLGWCPLWKPLDHKWPLYDRNTTRTFPKGAVRCSSCLQIFPPGPWSNSSAELPLSWEGNRWPWN